MGGGAARGLGSEKNLKNDLTSLQTQEIVILCEKCKNERKFITSIKFDIAGVG